MISSPLRLGVAGLALVLVATPLATAQSLEGLFAVYEFSVTTDAAQHTGVFRQEVLRDYGDGRVQLRTEVQTAETRLILERNVTASRARFPVLPPILEGFELTLARNLANLSVSLTPQGQQSVLFQGAVHAVNTTAYMLEVVKANATTTQEFTLNGTVQAFTSGLLYAADGQYTTTGAYARRARFELVLEATNLPLDAGSAAIAFFPSLREQAAQTPEVVSGSGLRPEALWALGGVAAIVAAFLYLGLGRRRKRAVQEAPPAERPPHWVS